MTTIFFRSLLFVAGILFIGGCDYIGQPLEPVSAGPNTPVDTTSEGPVIQKFILEEFTGHTCSNCPEAATKAQELKQIYGDQLIPVSIHAGFFAKTQNNADGSFKTDFRTPEGNAYYADFNSSDAVPKGMVNRDDTLNERLLNSADWGTALNLIKNKAPEIKLKISYTYDNVTRMLNVTTTTTALVSRNDTLNLVIGITEDNIVDWQQDGTNKIAAYKHRHVFRGTMNNAWGEQISTSFAPDATVSKSYSKTLSSSWNVANCTIIAYVYKYGTKEMVQAEEVHIVP